MFNNCYTYKKETSTDSYQVNDYTSYYYGGMTQIFDNNPELFEYITIDDDMKIEIISYNRYGSENFSDVILACNNEVFLWSMPYSTDVLIEEKEALARIFVSELGVGVGDARFEDFQVFLEAIDADVEDRNTQKRILRVPLRNKMSDVMNIITNYKRQNQINQFDDFVET